MSSKIILPKYLTKQPSTGATVEFRPFTVKEEKSLLLALQEDNMETVALAIKNVISICTDGKIDPNKVPYYDIEYIFLQIRAKSVGEIINLVGSCECDPKSKTEFEIDISDTKIEPMPTGNQTIKIPDTQYTMVFRHPSIDDFVTTFQSGGELAEQVVTNCIVSIYTGDEVMDWDYDQKLEFVESMTTKQQKDIAEFMSNMPMVKMGANYTCKHCTKVHNTNISGFESFFV